MKGTLTISRVTGNDGEFMRVEVRQPGSMKPVVSLAITPEQLMMALTGRAFVPVEIERMAATHAVQEVDG